MVSLFINEKISSKYFLLSTAILKTTTHCLLVLSLHFHRNAAVSYYKKQKTLIHSSCLKDDVCCGVFLFVWNFMRATHRFLNGLCNHLRQVPFNLPVLTLVFVFLTLWPILERHEFLQVLLSVRSEKYFDIIKS